MPRSPDPHLHIGPAIPDRGILSGVHLPTAVVRLADVVALMLGELRARPARRDWRRILARLRA